MTMVTPAWVQDNSGDLSKLSAEEAADAAAMGLGYRMEHLFRADCTLEIDGRTRSFKGLGTRVHRQSIRRLDGFFGHCWQSAVFPDGRAFGICVYPPKDDGSERYNDAFIYQDGRMYKARSVNTAFLRRIVASGDEAPVELESELGRTFIEGVTTHSTFQIA